MEKRYSRRFNVFLKAALLSAGACYEGFVGNISENGMYVRIRRADAGINFTPEMTFDLSLILPSEETLNLRCRPVWAYEIPIINQPGRSAYNLGLEVINPVSGYKDLYKNVAMENFNHHINSISEK